MPNRILKESICSSDTINELTWFEEAFWYRLIVNCDDFGRFDGRVTIIKSRLFPLKSGVTDKNVSDALNKLSSVGLVARYLYGNKPYLQLVTWSNHQQVRTQKSKYPSPDDEKSVKDDTCNQLIADDSKCPRNPIQSESNPNPNPNPNSTAAPCANVCSFVPFDEFWKLYPKKQAKTAAEKAWQKIKPDDELFAKIKTALEQQKASLDWQKDNGRFVPMPATWLNGKRWEDEVSGLSGASVKISASTSEAEVGRLGNWV